MSSPLLFSIDLEWFYAANSRRMHRETPVPVIADRILEQLRLAGCRATFFVVGELARKFPELVARIAAAGHELGCHGDRHITLDRLERDGFARDLRENRRALEAIGIREIQGFRAPVFSLTEATSWAYPLLRDAGFVYSSSVLPAANPLFGWPGFGSAPRSIDGIREIPITLGRIGPLVAPLYSGTYLRVLPWTLVRRRFRRQLASGPVLAYAHPYDFDAAQPWTMHAGVRGNIFLNALLFIGRSRFERRIASLLRLGGQTTTYADFIAGQP